MKKALLTLAAFALAGSAFAQGTIQMSNSNLPGATPGTTYEAVITLGPGLNGQFPGDAGAGAYTAALFLDGSTTPLAGSSTTFFAGTGAEQPFNYIFNSEPQVTVSGINPGQTGQFYVGAWRTSDGTFANAVATGASGRSATFTSRPLGGPNPTPGELPFTTPVTTFQGFQITLVPEPTTMALGLIGLGALALRRRK
jgi:hypothetical protein